MWVDAPRGNAAGRWRRVVAPAVLLAWLTCEGPALAADVDLVVLRNGDRLHGEIKSLQFGRLELSTTAMGLVYVEWDKVVGLVSASYFEVETSDGARHYGTFPAADPGTLTVALENQQAALLLPLVVRIRPLKSSFWSRIDGSVSLGASYARSSEVGQGSLAVSLVTRRPGFEFRTDFDATLTSQPNEPATTRTVWSASYMKNIGRRWFVPAVVKLERNTDLGLNLRSSIGGGLSRTLAQTNRSLVRAGGGLLLNREDGVSGESTDNIEAFFGASYEFFTYDTPKTSITTNFAIFPSLNVGGRFRTDLDVDLRREIIRDFTVGITVYDSYDNKPPDGNTRTHDFGFTLSVGWTF
jgi:hypothetical protein